MTTKELLTGAEAAALIGRDVSVIKGWVSQGLLVAAGTVRVAYRKRPVYRRGDVLACHEGRAVACYTGTRSGARRVPAPEGFLTTLDAARLMGLTRPGVIARIKAGTLPAVTHQGIWVIAVQDIPARVPKQASRMDAPLDVWDGPPVLYGFLSAADVKELERRRAKYQAKARAA